jgi:hypothetical protein
MSNVSFLELANIYLHFPFFNELIDNEYKILAIQEYVNHHNLNSNQYYKIINYLIDNELISISYFIELTELGTKIFN